MSPPRIELVSASAQYQGRVILEEVNLTIQQGERVALIGRSGAGKSTLLRLIYEHYNRDTALVPQDEGLVQSLSVFHNAYMGRLGHHNAFYNLLNLVRPFPGRVAEIRDILEKLALDAKMFEPVAQLSGGQRQRTAIARSLYAGGNLLLADEPVSALDETQSRAVMRLMADYFETQVLALHDVALALEFCSRIIGLQDGKIVLDAPSADLDPTELMQLYRD